MHMIYIHIFIYTLIPGKSAIRLKHLRLWQYYAVSTWRCLLQCTCTSPLGANKASGVTCNNPVSIFTVSHKPQVTVMYDV